MTNFLTSIMMISCIISAKAQTTTNELLSDYRKIVFFSGGDSTTAFVPPHLGYEIADGVNLVAPWELQEDISAVPESVIPEITTKVKSKFFEKYKIKDYDGFVLDNKTYHSFNVKSAVSVGDNWQFVELFSTGKISLYYLYYTPAVSTNNNGLGDTFIRYAENPTWIFYKENSKRTARYIEDLASKRELSDCPEVYDNFKNKVYRVGYAEKKLITDKEREDANLLAIHDYNGKCK